jgi:hypothetical protein
MTVRDRIDQLLSQPAVGDLGYPADQRSVASMVLGLKLLADSIDAILARLDAPGGPADPLDPSADVTAEVRDLSAHLEELTAHVRKLAKTIKNLTQKE